MNEKERKIYEKKISRVIKDIIKLEKKHGINLMRTASMRRINYLRATKTRKEKIKKLESELKNLQRVV